MRLNYKNIEKMLGGEVFGGGVSDDGETVIVEFDGRDDDGNPIYKATWESKRTDSRIWYVVHYYHKDGTVEEMFEHEPLTT